MRDIKFRAWNGPKMIYNIGIMPLTERRDADSMTTSRPYEVYFRPDKWKVMQYTGLKDKNGKEIYEGDIVAINAFEPRLNIVRFDRGGFCLEPILEAPLHSSFWSDIKYAEDDRSEVIGNIYENPELINHV